MGKSIPLAALIILLLMAIAFQYYITSLPDLEEPITLADASSLNDGGSIAASFVDNDGHRFRFGVRGDSGGERETFPAFYIRDPDRVPYVYWPSIGGPDERKLLRLLDGWIQNNVSPAAMERLQQAETGMIGQPEQELLAVYQIYDILRQRNQL